MIKFHLILSRKWHFFKHMSNQRQVLFNIPLGQVCFDGIKVKVNDGFGVGLGTAFKGNFLQKAWVNFVTCRAAGDGVLLQISGGL